MVGAHALGVHGVPRATGDLDLWIRPDPDNAARVWRALDRFGAPVRAHGLDVSDLAIPGTVYQLGLPPFRIDLLTQISGCEFDLAWSSRLERLIDGRRVPYLGLGALVANKRATGRTRDLLDLELLREAGVVIEPDGPDPSGAPPPPKGRAW